MTCVAIAVGVGCDSGSDDGAATTTTSTAPDASGRFPAGSIERSWSGSGPKVVVLGDSIVVQSRAALHERLDPRFRAKVGALIGEGFAGGPFTNALDADEPLVRRAARDYAQDPPAVVVIALGTNDAWQPELELADALSGLREMVDLFGGACIVGVEVNDWAAADGYDRAEARAINEELAVHSDELVPALGPEHVQPDMIHPTDAGVETLVQRVADAVERCTP